jgi:hypothetical protein
VSDSESAGAAKHLSASSDPVDYTGQATYHMVASSQLQILGHSFPPLITRDSGLLSQILVHRYFALT